MISDIHVIKVILCIAYQAVFQIMSSYLKRNRSRVAIEIPGRGKLILFESLEIEIMAKVKTKIMEL